jgi:osmotically-inducible protein OsmY
MKEDMPMTFAQGNFGIAAARTAVVLAAFLFAGPSLALALEKDLTDANISNAVENCFFFDKAVPFDPIDVSCTDGIVTLTGTTNNILAKQRATRLAQTIKGVRAVVNRIEVKPSMDRTGVEIKSDVEAALLSDPATDLYEITVTADNKGHVTLSGEVESWQEKQLVKKVAMGVKGVTGITNNVDVHYKTDRSDYEIKPEIEEALEWDALVDHQLIDVKVKDGKVTLSGTVGSAAEKRQARWDAWVAGVTDVNDSGLKVRRWARDEDQRKNTYMAKPESEISQAVEDANLYDPRVKSFNVNPDVIGSMVTLRGTVDNLKAKRAAGENARNTVGVSRVYNRLKVRPAMAHTDEQIETAVQSTLLRDPYVDRYQIAVNVVDGMAYLTGTVDSYFEKAQAEDAASRVNGVVNVSNGLAVTDTHSPIVYDPYIYDWYVEDYDWYDYRPVNAVKTDKEIKTAIESELWWSPFVDSDEVAVEVEDGVAALFGTVDSWSERRAATHNALEGGAIRVDNDLVVAMR